MTVQVKANIRKPFKYYTPSEQGLRFGDDLQTSLVERINTIAEEVTKEAQVEYDKAFNELLADNIISFFEDEAFSVYLDPNGQLQLWYEEGTVDIDFDTMLEDTLEHWAFCDDEPEVDSNKMRREWAAKFRAAADRIESGLTA